MQFSFGGGRIVMSLAAFVAQGASLMWEAASKAGVRGQTENFVYRVGVRVVFFFVADFWTK